MSLVPRGRYCFYAALKLTLTDAVIGKGITADTFYSHHMQVGDLPRSPQISPDLPTSPQISPDLLPAGLLP